MAANSTNISPLQYPPGTAIKGAKAMSDRHNWDAITQHIQLQDATIKALTARVEALERAGGTISP